MLNIEKLFLCFEKKSNKLYLSLLQDLRPVGANQPKFAAELSENKGKNRYNNVLPCKFPILLLYLTLTITENILAVTL